MPRLLEHMDPLFQPDQDRRYKCDECGRGYRHAGSLANHKKTHDVGSFECDICGKENSNALALKSHLRTHTSRKKYSCAECGKAFRLAKQLATHERVHQTRGAKQSSSKEDVDCFTVENVQDLEDDPHSTEQSSSLVVSVDNSPTGAKSEAFHSIQSEGSDESMKRPFKCDLCDKSYIHLRSLAYHKKSHQTGSYKCRVCLKYFNNMAALYSHQRTHKSRSDIGESSHDSVYTDTSQKQFSPQNHQEDVGNFCHLCQVLFPDDEEFQEHIQIHNSSSQNFGLEDTLPEDNSIYSNSIPSPESNFYQSQTSNHSVASLDNHSSFHLSEEKIGSNAHLDSGSFYNNQNAFPISTQEELQQMGTNSLSPTLIPPQSSGNTTETEETSTSDSNERPFKCQTCGKSYRHSGSLINHKRSHQVGIFQCSICRKSYPHLAALKSHLRLHKGQSPSFNISAAGDWLSSEPLTLENHQGCSSPKVKVDEDAEEENPSDPVFEMDQENEENHSDEELFKEGFSPDFSQNVSADLPHDDHMMSRHMCADCNETFADIAGIKSHKCPMLQNQHDNSVEDFCTPFKFQPINSGNAENDSEYHNPSGSQSQIYFEQSFHENVNSDQINGNIASDDADDDDEDDDDGDLYQCSLCGNSYTSMRALRSHLRGHTQSHGTPPNSGSPSFSSHKETKHETGEMMICSTCGESFANQQGLIAHQLLHETVSVDSDGYAQMSNGDVQESKEGAQNIICGGCGIFSNSYHHLQNHNCPAETKAEPVPSKEEKTNDSGELKEATLPTDAAHSEGHQYKCDHCGRSYRHPGSLLNHKKSHKTGVFRCLVCQKRFYNLLALKNHQRSHFDIKRHTCHECGKAFKIQKQLLNHLRRHKENQAKIQELNNQIQALMQMNGTKSEGGMQPLTSNANQAFTYPEHHKQPRKEGGKKDATVKVEHSNNERPFACDQCGRTYRHAGSLVNHKNSHKVGEYYCSICNNTYPNRLAMKNHMRTHFSFKRHFCQKCGKRFRGRKQLLVHVCADVRKDRSKIRRALKSRVFRCKKCKQAFFSGEQLEAHTCEAPSGTAKDAQVGTTSIKEERPFKCNICHRSYRHAGSLLNHKNTHKTGHFICNYCSKPFTNPMALRNHMRIHTQKKKFVCLTCGKAFRLASILYNHQKVHNRVAGSISCSTCGKRFQGRSGLKRHRCHREDRSAAQSGICHTEKADKCFTCDLCGRSYRHAGSLLNHKKTHSENLHHCTLCLQTFPDSLTLQMHSQMRRHCCPECGKTFCLLSHLQSHMEVHSKDRTVVCNLCQQSFPNAAIYQEHHNVQHMGLSLVESVHNDLSLDSEIDHSMNGMSNEVPPPLSHIPVNVRNSQKMGDASAPEEKSHVCEHCGRTYRHAGSLLNHKNSHKTGSYYCNVCQKEFTNLMALRNHRRIHTEPKRYQCQECGKAFRVSTQLVSHRRIHTKERPFTCMLCEKSFSSKANLRHHQKLHQTSQTYNSSFSLDANSFMDLDMASFF